MSIISVASALPTPQRISVNAPKRIKLLFSAVEDDWSRPSVDAIVYDRAVAKVKGYDGFIEKNLTEVGVYEKRPTGTPARAFALLLLSARCTKDGKAFVLRGPAAESLYQLLVHDAKPPKIPSAEDRPRQNWIQKLFDVPVGEGMPKELFLQVPGRNFRLGDVLFAAPLFLQDSKNGEDISNFASKIVWQLRRLFPEDEYVLEIPMTEALRAAPATRERLARELAAAGIRVVFRDLREHNSIRVAIALSSDDVSRLEDLLRSNALSDLQIKLIPLSEADPASWADRALKSRPVEIEPEDSAADAKLKRFFQHARRVEILRRPWRRMVSLLSPSVSRSPAASVLRHSSTRCYALASTSQLRDLVTDFSIGWFAWPLLTVVLVGVACLIASLAGLQVTPLVGIAVGLLMASVVGSHVCSTVVAPVSCLAGGAVGIGSVFGFCASVVFERGGRDNILGAFLRYQSDNLTSYRADAFNLVNGGFVGLTAPFWLGPLHSPLVTALVLLLAAGIGYTAWIMAQPLRTRVPANLPSRTVKEFSQEAWPLVRRLQLIKLVTLRWPVPLAAIAGFFAGLGIPAVKFLAIALAASSLFSPRTGFTLAFALIGGGLVVFMVQRQAGSWPRALGLGAAHAAVSLVLCSAAFAFDQGRTGLFTAALACSWFQSTFYTGAFWIGLVLSESPEGAFWAAAAEGMLGFGIYTTLRILHLA